MPFRVNFPNMFMALVRAPTAQRPQAVFRVYPKMNKFEIKEYLTKIYNIPVLKVHTANLPGRYKRIMGRRKIMTYKRPDFKHAFITLDESAQAVNDATASAGAAEGGLPQPNQA